LGEGNSSFLIKGPGPLQREDNCKNGVESFKNSRCILKNYEARKAEFYMNSKLSDIEQRQVD
jgi:hypothetical protein